MSSIDISTLDYYSARQDWSQLIEAAHTILAQDPDNYQAHDHLVYAYIGLNNYHKAEQHLEAIRNLNPEALTTFQTGIFLLFHRSRYKEAKKLVHQALTHYPDYPYFYFYDAAIAARQLKIRYAKEQIAKAKELDPNDPEIADLYLRIHGMNESSAKAALKRIEEYRLALKNDPENAALHQGIGDVYMDDLHQAAQASLHYREAVRLKPDDKDYSKALFHAVAMQSIVYGLVSLPSRAFSFLRDLAVGLTIQPWRLLFLIFAVKLIFAFFIWLMLATIVFWIPSKIYEHLLVSEIKNSSSVSLKRLQSWFYFQNKPIWMRFSLFLGFATLLYSALLFSLGTPQANGFLALGAFIGIHLAFLIPVRAFRKIRYKFAQKRINKH